MAAFLFLTFLLVAKKVYMFPFHISKKLMKHLKGIRDEVTGGYGQCKIFVACTKFCLDVVKSLHGSQ